jgi:5-methylcytosine-specific restriction endonuclease McrA
MPTPYDHTWRQVRLQVLERDDHRCMVGDPGCTSVATEVDHIIPLAEGGQRLDLDNLRGACTRCNRGRNNRRSAELAKALERPAPSAGTPSRDW